MALSGNFKHIIYTESPTETEVVSITYPADLPADDENYDKRGTTEEVTRPLIIEDVTTHANSYIRVHTLNAFLVNAIDQGVETYSRDIQVNYRVYNSKEDAVDVNNYIHQKDIFLQEIDLDSNLYTQVYTSLKSLPEFEDVIDA